MNVPVADFEKIQSQRTIRYMCPLNGFAVSLKAVAVKSLKVGKKLF